MTDFSKKFINDFNDIKEYYNFLVSKTKKNIKLIIFRIKKVSKKDQKK